MEAGLRGVGLGSGNVHVRCRALPVCELATLMADFWALCS